MSAAVSEEERRKKSVYYEACTSPFKDDFATLVKCLRTHEPGNPHTRQEAGFLLWHHALEGDGVSGLLAAGLLAACVANLDSPELLSADKACSAGILLALVGDDEEVAEQLVRTRGPSGRSALEVLHAVLVEDGALARHHCGQLLQSLAHQVAPLVLRAMEFQLPFVHSYVAVWGIPEHRDAPAVAAVGELVTTLLEQRPELAGEVVGAGGVSALLDAVRHHKSEAAVGAAVRCLARLLVSYSEPKAAAEQLEGLGGVPLLLDVLGPPPRVALENRPEAVEEDEQPASPAASEPLSPSRLTAAAVAATGVQSPRSTGGSDDASAARASNGGGGGGSDGGAIGGGGGGGGGGDRSPHTTAAAAAAAVEQETSDATNRRISFAQHLVHQPPSPIKTGGSAGGGGSGGGGGGSPLGSPGGGRFKASTSSDGGGGGGGAGGWSSARSSSRSLGSHPSVSLRVQLPLVIPGIHSPSVAAAAAAAEAADSPTPPPTHRPPLLLPSISTARGRASSFTVFAAAAAASVSATPAAAPAASGAAAGHQAPVWEADGSGGGAVLDASAATASGAAVGAAAAVAAAPPPLPSASDLAANRSGLRWFMLPGLEVASASAACLMQVVMQRPSCRVVLELRYASHRILAQLRAALGRQAATEGSGLGRTKGKKKGLGLSAEQTAGLTRLLGLLKFLSMNNMTRYRIARLGAVPMLVRLYYEAGDYTLRNHCQAILANVASLAENGAALKEAGTPEEFLVANPMRLTSYERAVLRIEFPDEPALLQPRGRC